MRINKQLVMWLFLVSVLTVAQMPRLAAQVRTRANTPAVAAQSAPQADSQAVSSPSAVVPALPVPRLVKFSGVAKDNAGAPLTGVVGISFSIYKDQEGGSALWMETQNVELDSQGNYTVLLGSTQSEGVPMDLFSPGEPRWLGVKVELDNEAEQARVLLVSVPYALKASDADTLGGKPASAYMLAPPQVSGTASGQAAPTTASSGTAAATSTTTGNAKASTATSSITADYIPMFTNSSGTLSNSNIFQSSSGNIGIGYTSPNAKLLIGAPAGGAVLNATNLADQDMQITLTAPGASDKKTYFGTSTPTNLTLGVNSTEMMRITDSGNVGIGYPAPTNARVVIGTPKGGAVINSSNLTDQDMFITLTAPGASDKHAYFGPSTPTNLTMGVNNTEMMRITNSGYVGIGTSTPAYQLDVEGVGLTANYILASGGLGNDGIDAYSSDDVAIYGDTDAYAGGYFESDGTGYGSVAITYTDSNLYAAAAGWNYGGTQEDLGVYGYTSSPLGIGSYAEGYEASAEGGNCCAGDYTIGLWADTSGNSGSVAGIGALTTVDNGYSIVSYSNSTTTTVWLENDETSDTTSDVLVAYGSDGSCAIDVSGDLTCSGTVSPAVAIKGGASKVALYGVQAAENWFEDAGSGQLSHGAAVVQLEGMFAETVNTGVEYHVFLTPNGDCKGLYVSQKSATSFEVHELGGGTSNIAFDYRIMAKRRGYETVRLADVTRQLAAKGPVRRALGTRGPNPDQLRKQRQQKLDELRKVADAKRAAALKHIQR